jgi:hypothetical protein
LAHQDGPHRIIRKKLFTARALPSRSWDLTLSGQNVC